MTVNRDQKSQLAKLMATENITVQHQKAETASFDVKNRVLTLPIFKDEMSNDVYDLMVSHEVAHALWTPLEGWHDAVCENGPMYKGFLNIIEDARIERLIKAKFPGLLGSYRKGYKELLDKDFFGIAGKDLNDFSFIDRINIFFKTGTLTGLRFEGEELKWIERIAKATTFAEVKAIADELFPIEQKKAEEKAQEMAENGEFDEFEDGDDGDDWDDGEENEDTYTSGSGNSSGEPDDTEEDTQDTSGDAGKTTSPQAEKQENTPKPNASAMQEAIEKLIGGETEKNLHKNQSMLNKMNAREIEYHYLPASVKNYGEFIVGHKEVIALFDEQWATQPGYLKENTEKMAMFRKSNIKIINTMVKEFEMRKKADEHKRTSVSKSGELDMNKIFGYKFNDDLFLRNAVVRDGKNHGFVMYIDWSGSMASQMAGTIDQLMNLAMFCKKVRIPFEVFAFSDGWVKRDYEGKPAKVNVDQFQLNDMVPSGFSLIQLLSTTMSTTDYNKMLVNLMSVRNALENGRYYRGPVPSKMQLGATPLNDALTITTDVIRDFKAKYRVQVVNFVVLTDGESHACGQIKKDEYGTNEPVVSPFYQSYRTDATLIDRVTQKQYKMEDRNSGVTDALLKAIKARTGCNTIGIFLVDNKPREIRSVFGRYGIWNADIKEFRAKKFFALTNAGYDTYFLMPGGDLALDDDEFEVAGDASKARIKTAFLKHSKGKTDNRVFVSKLMEIAA